jgi:hypothetical protein
VSGQAQSAVAPAANNIRKKKGLGQEFIKYLEVVNLPRLSVDLPERERFGGRKLRRAACLAR